MARWESIKLVHALRPLGESGLVVSVAGLGCNNFGSRLDLDGARAVVDAAIDAGITLFDISDTYGGGGGSERALGPARQLAAGHRLPVQRRHVRAEHGRIGDLRGKPALLVAADDPDHRALPGQRVDVGQERSAAGPVGVAAAVELELPRHRLPGPV